MRLRAQVAVGVAACAALAMPVSVGLARVLVTNEREGSERERIGSLRTQVQQEARMHAATHPKPDSLSARPLPTPDPPAPTGIIPIVAPFPTSQYLIEENGWQSVSGVRRTTAYPGASARDPEQGVVLVGVFRITPPNPPPRFFEESDESDIIDFGVYPTPTRSGSVRIVDATGMVLTLLADDGTELRFDVASLRYLR